MSKFFEWYYFDIHTKAGYDVVFTLHTKPFMSCFDISIFDFFIYKDKQRLAHHFYTRPQKQQVTNTNGFTVRYDQQNYLKHNDIIQLEFKDEQVEFKLKLNPLVSMDKPVEMNLLPGDNDQEYFKWIVYAPMCEASGKLTFNEFNIQLDGLAYHDYNCGNINFKQKLKGWYWGKFYQEDRLSVIGQIEDRDGNKKNVYLKAENKELHWSQDVKILREENRISCEDSVFDENEKWMLDNINLFVSATGGRVSVFMCKIREVVIFFSSRWRFFPYIEKILTNASYSLFRVEATSDTSDPVVSFYEDIKF